MKKNQDNASQVLANVVTTALTPISTSIVPAPTTVKKLPTVVNVPDKVASIVERKPKVPTVNLFDELQIEKQSDIVQQLESKIKKLEEQIKHEPQSIEERMEYYKQKKELTVRFEKYQTQLLLLEQLRVKVLETNGDELDFAETNDKYCLKIVRLSQYGSEDKKPFTIVNPNIIDSIIDLIKERMEIKKDELQQEIAS